MKQYLKAFMIVGLSFALMGQTRFPPQGTSGAGTLAGDNTWTGVQTFDDEAFLVCDNGDGTKCLEFETSGITGSTTRTYTWPDVSGNVAVSGSAVLGGTYNFTALVVNVSSAKLTDNVELVLGSGSDGIIDWNTGNTPDVIRFGLGSDSNAVQFLEAADRATTVFANGPWGTSTGTNPSIGIFSNDGTSANKWFYLWHDEANAHIGTGTGGILGYRYPVEVVITTKTPASTTDSTDEGCELYTNTGDTDGSTITLPNDPIIGSCYIISVVAAQTVTVIPNTNELLYTPGDQCAVDMTSATQGAILEFIAVTGGDAAIWHTKGDQTGWACNDS